VRSTNANGIVGYDLYETTVTLPDGNTNIPVVTASANHKDVKVDVVQSDLSLAVVKCDYKGIVKTYTILFKQE
jgi:arabinoxylan arabinofuranohydrolase